MMTSVSARHATEVRRGERFEFGKNWRQFFSTSAAAAASTALLPAAWDVRSFDFDSNSVACTKELRRRYFPNDDHWVIEQGSVLDHDFLTSLGEFDIVYSWGVLHHTGAMWQALDGVKELVKPGGQLYIAIYNHLGEVTDGWRKVKRTYN